MKQISYLRETDKNINEDLVSRKEFLLFKKSVEVAKFQDKLKEEDERLNIIPKFIIEKSYLELKSYQMLVRNYMNPNTPYSRLLLNLATGSGKTVGSIAIAMNFIQKYQHNDMGSVFIVGFTQTIFINELLKYPEFGFISRDELNTLALLKKRSYTGNIRDIEQLQRFYTSIKKRLYNRKDNGFFKFIGYKELANHLFFYNRDENESEGDEEMRIELSSMSQEELKKNIDEKKITINKKILDEFSSSLIICDEIHNTYNTTEKNNWGLALQIILNYHDSCRALFLSATPLNNSSTEIIDLLNLLLPRKYYPNLDKKDFFIKKENDYIFKESKKEEIISYLRGRVSFIQNKNTQFIATKSFKGESIKDISFLKFVRCTMSKFHYETYKNTDEISQDSVYLADLVLPDPEVKNPYKFDGIYKPNDVKFKLESSSVKWKADYGISYNSIDETISGSILQLKNLENISSKYYHMVNALIQNINNKGGKTFIYHNYIHNTGTLLIQEILLQNNIIGEFDNSLENTLCCVCGNKRKNHSAKQLDPLLGNDVSHFYYPVRFAIVHSNLEKNIINRSLEKFNHVNNVDGYKIMILIGSKLIKESHSINSVRNIYIMSKPDNISTLIQVIGRAIRLGSHKLLPLKQRHVDISIFVSSLPHKGLSYEELKYKEKIESFKQIQKLEKIMHENAIDAYFNYDIIWPDTKEKTNLDILPYSMNKISHTELNLSTFNAYYAKDEVDYCIYLIKRLFIEVSSVWTYKDLFNAVKLPPFPVELNTTMISHDLFNIGLNNLLYINNSIDVDNLEDIVDKLHNPDDKIIIHGDIKYVITHVDNIYCMVPIYYNEPFVNPEITFRNISLPAVKLIDIGHFLQNDSSKNYTNKKLQFISRWKFTNLIDLEQSLHDFGIKFHIMFIEEIIAYMFNIWTSDQKKKENHLFYLKMLYFYDLHNLIAWAHLLDKTLEKKYSKYVTQVSVKPIDSSINFKENIENNILISSLNRNKEWASSGIIKEFENSILESEKLFDKVYKKSNTIKKVKANLLPVGHYLGKIPRFYDKIWFDHVITKNKSTKENDIVIGYDKRSNTGISIRFKLRSPINYNNKDDRLIEQGTVCNSKSKIYLKDISKKLNIVIDSHSNTDNICNLIRNRLIYLELKEREKENGVKYFYNVLEDSFA
jgi:Helicase conserved C-terminal domain/Type III restriction enzyme, res subunit